MKLSVLAFGVVVLAVTSSSFAGPKLPAPKSLPGPKSPAATPVTPATPKAVPAGHQHHIETKTPVVRRVSWSYTKLHQPQVVAAMLRDVKNGDLPRSALTGLGGRGSIDKLLAAAPAADEPTARGTGAPPKGQTRDQFREQSRSAAPSGWGSLAAVLPPKPEYAPSKLVFADAYDKEVKRATVWFTANRDDFVTASIATDAPFRIQRMASYDGSYTITPAGPLPTTWDSDKVAPFGLGVRAGQQFSVTVEFAPEFELGTMMAGAKKGTLAVKGEQFSVKVPLSATFNGVRVAGVLLSPTEELVTVDALVPASSHTFATKMRVFNIGNEARTATISADALPSGVTLVGSPSVSLAANETKDVDVAFELKGGSYGNGQPMVLRANATGGHTSSTNLTMNLVRTEMQWEFQEEAHGIEFWLMYRLSSTGSWYFVGTEHNVGSPLGWDMKINLELGGETVGWPIGASIGTMTGAAGKNPGYQHRGWKSAGPGGGPWTKDDYAELIAKPAQFRIEMDSRP